MRNKCIATIFVQKNAQFIQAGNAGRRLASSSGTANSTGKPEETRERASGRRLFRRERYHDVCAVRLATDERTRMSSTNKRQMEGRMSQAATESGRGNGALKTASFDAVVVGAGVAGLY